MKIKLCKEDKQQFLDISKDRRVFLEGNIIKLIDGGDDEIFKQYLLDAKTQDIDNRKKRLEVTKQVQIQNRELIASQEENESLMIELKEAVIKADEAKDVALTDLDLMQKKTQFELIGRIVSMALWIIAGVGIFTTSMLAKETKILRLIFPTKHLQYPNQSFHSTNPEMIQCSQSQTTHPYMLFYRSSRIHVEIFLSHPYHLL